MRLSCSQASHCTVCKNYFKVCFCLKSLILLQPRKVWTFCFQVFEQKYKHIVKYSHCGDVHISKIILMSFCVFFLQYLVTDIYQFCIVIIPMVVGGTTLNVITTSAMTKSVAINKTGAVLGLSMATNSLIRTVSPTLGSIMYKNYGWPSFGALGLVVNAAVALFLFLHGKDSF